MSSEPQLDSTCTYSERARAYVLTPHSDLLYAMTCDPPLRSAAAAEMVHGNTREACVKTLFRVSHFA